MEFEMSRIKRWLLVIFGLPVLYLLALNYRYEPVAGSQTAMGTISVWDRWHNRVCVVSISLGNKPVCTIEQMKGAGQ
jgi:hypothetical protein